MEKQDPAHEMFALTNSSSLIDSVNSESQIIIFIMASATPRAQTALDKYITREYSSAKLFRLSNTQMDSNSAGLMSHLFFYESN